MIRMLEGFIGQDEFKKGIRHYLNKFKYSNATTKDLWNSFDPKLEVESFMNDWINKQGYPIVYVSEDKEDILLRQSQFLLSGRKSDSIWKIPITFSWGETILMTQREIKVKKKSPVYKINMGGYAFFRTSYDTQNLAHLLESTTDVENKLNLVNDIFALCNAKMMKAIDVIVLCELFRDETNPEILSSIFSTLNKFKSLWYENENVLKHLNEVISDLIGSRVNEIDIFTKEFSEDWITTNSILINNALRSGNSKIIKNLKEAYGQKGSINPEFIRSVFISVIDEKYEEIFSLTKTSTIPEEKIVALSSLANINNEKSLLKILSKFNEFEPHNSIYFFLNLILNEKNRDLILNFICENFDEIRSFMKNDRLFSYVVERVLSCASTEKISLKIIELLNLKKNGEIEMSVNKAIEKIKWNLEFKEFNKEVIKN
ncbi:M1 family aminopeptidase 1 [Nosema bombycis CQ1]|uniref:M1 family aminopeptidase 1 n=1 Tax=Nosema bombycis (strain CQ1 / CVCC 102059) TaxID=578461 RepID=R0KTF7_NOSB1|nr:M1 family aminopeptidase 1 [Nosema bombycis CQ1]|eukprot:EOB14096.1 M1 family aminopeptidase 1 [Nosema bombycis CQ1]